MVICIFFAKISYFRNFDNKSFHLNPRFDADSLSSLTYLSSLHIQAGTFSRKQGTLSRAFGCLTARKKLKFRTNISDISRPSLHM